MIQAQRGETRTFANQELPTESDIPQGLKPGIIATTSATAEAVPLQILAPAVFTFRWSWWALIPLVLATAACAVPWLLAHSPEIGLALQRGFGLVCHQQPERSFVLFGGSVAVCARCLGIYFGATMGLLLRVSRRVARGWLIAAFALNLVDWAAELAGLHGNWMGARFAMGLTLGATVAMLVIVSLGKVKIPTQAKECSVP